MKKLGFGVMRLPLINEEDSTSIDLDLTKEMIDLYMNNGFNYFDTAYSYHSGKSEEVLRDLLVKRYGRDEFILTDKLPLFSLKNEDDLETIFNNQLKRCGVDYFDYYLLHNLNTWTKDVFYDFNCFDFIEKKKEEGKIKHIGFSSHDDSEFIEKILKEFRELEIIQLQINYLDWNSESIQSKKCYEIARKYNKDIIVMEPIKGGSLTKISKKAEKIFKDYNPDLSIASWAIRFVTSLKGVCMVLSGMNTIEQLKDNIHTIDNFKPLNDEEYGIIEKAIEAINDSIAISCTQCNYCVDTCPKDIPISKYFDLYNIEKRLPSKGFSPQHAYYTVYSLKHTKASQCIECGMCEENCPQHIDIINKLNDVAELFEDD